MGHERERDEADGTAGRAAAGHLELPDSGERPPHVAALYDCGDDPYATDQLAILCVAPVEHCTVSQSRDQITGSERNGATTGKSGLRTVEGQESERELDAGEDAKEEKMEQAKRFERLDPLLSGTNRRRWCVTINFRTSAIALFRGFRAETFPSRLRQRDREESGLRHEQDERENRRGGIDVELGAQQQILPKRHGLGGKVRADGRADAEAYREGDANVREGLCTVGGRGDVGEDRAFFMQVSIAAGDHAKKMTYIANWTLPSLSPPMTRESMYDAKVVLFIQLQKQGEYQFATNVTRRRIR